MYGHTEGAAGLTGVLAAAAAVTAAERPPVVNLAHLNPYVASAFEDWSISKVYFFSLLQVLPHFVGNFSECYEVAFKDMTIPQLRI